MGAIFNQKQDRVIISICRLERFKHSKDLLVEKDLARYWSNWCCKWLFWKERQIVLYRRQTWKTSL